MNIRKIHFPVKSLGPGSRVVIYTSGCNKKCPGCMSKDLRVTKSSDNISINDVIEQIKNYGIHLIDGVTISGGEPFLQENLLELVTGINDIGIDDILIYSGYKYEELISSNMNDARNILSHISVLVDGEYIESLNDNKSLRGSSNQRVIVLNSKYETKYREYMEKERFFEYVQNDTSIDFYGIFPKGMEKNIKEAFSKNKYIFKSSNERYE